MSSKLLKSIEKLHKHSGRDPSSVIYIRRDMDELFITNGFVFNLIFGEHKFVSSNFLNESIGTASRNPKYPPGKTKIPDDLEIHIRIKNDKVFFETEDYDLINIE